MGRSYCLSVVLFIAVLALFFCQGSGRKLKVPAFNKESLLLQQENQEKGRKMIGVMDYSDPVPNTNPRSGYLITPPSPPPPKGSA